MGMKKHLAHNVIIVPWMKWRHDHKLLSAVPGTQQALNNSKPLQILIIFPKIVCRRLGGRNEAAHELQMFM